jgi:replicative DNA helicase
VSGRGATGALPQADAAERALVGAALLAPWVLDLPGVVELRPEEFRSRRLGTAWRLIRAGARDLLTLECELARAGEPVTVTEIVEWCDAVTYAAHAPGHAALIRDAAARRRLAWLAAEIRRLLEDDAATEDVVEVVRGAVG